MIRIAARELCATTSAPVSGCFPETIDRMGYRALYRALACDDDTPELLALARAAVEARLARLSHFAPGPLSRIRRFDDATLEPAAPVGDCESAATAAAAQVLAPWLAGVGRVLRRIAQAATGEREPNVLLFGIHARCHAPGRQSAALQAMAERMVSSAAIGASDSIDEGDDDLYEALILRLSLSCFPQSLFPEILGYALAELGDAGRGSTWLRAGPDGLSAWVGDLAVRLRAERPVMAAVLKVVRREVAGADRKALAARIARGCALHDSLTAQVWQAFERRAHRATDPTGTLLWALRRKAAYAVGHHGRVSLAGRSLDAWFGERPFRAEAFLSALAASSWVDRQAPERSRLLTLLQFDGPMFGIFTSSEEAALRAWLAGLARPMALSPPVSAPVPVPTLSGTSRAMPRVSQPAAPGAGIGGEARAFVGSPRQLFHALVNPELHPLALPAARGHVERCLRRVTCDLRHRWSRFAYREPAFEAWLDRVYQRQMKGASGGDRDPKLPRDAYVYGIEQLAPAILVDGCWLQRCDMLTAGSPEVAHRLAAIYADEVGNGQLEHHHAWIYRKLLESLGIDCPPVESAAFAAHPHFLEAAFDLPVLLLAISVHSHGFLPELLGLNLAIEISGLGKAYGQLARDLEYWGIDARIIRLHQSIDNLASGHAALAKEAIVLHLRQVYGLGGDSAVQAHWRRIQTGFDLLRVVTRRFKWRLVVSYAVRRWVSPPVSRGARSAVQMMRSATPTTDGGGPGSK